MALRLRMHAPGVLLTLSLVALPLLSQTSPDLGRLFKQVSPAVLKIETTRVGGAKSIGSGFVVSADGKVVTNHHVVANAASINVRLANGDIFDDVEVLSLDKRRDLVILKIPAIELPAVQLGRSSSVSVGDSIFAVSNPLGVLDNTLSNGIVSGIRDLEGYKIFQISCPISKGSSGGPVFNVKGEVIGVAVFLVDSGQALNFAVPIDYARGMMAMSQNARGLEALRDAESDSKPPPATNEPTPPKPVQASTAVEEVRSAGLAVYLERQLGQWSPDGAKAVLGEPINHRYGYDQNRTIVNNIYAYKDPTSATPQVELAFNAKTEKLVGVYLYPVGLTWDKCKQLWGDDVRVIRNADGTKFHAYRNRRISVMLDKENKVLNIGLY